MNDSRPIVPDLIASCWTAGGDADAVGGETPSPVDLRARIEAAAQAGWRGFGLMYPDLMHARDTIGYVTLRRMLDDNGIIHVELEYLEDWWETGDRRAESDRRRADLFAAARPLGARHLKVGAGVTDAPVDFQCLLDGWAALCEDAAEHGVRLAIEAAPYSHLPTVQSMVRLVSEAGHPSGGLLLDVWHVYRSGTDYGDMAEMVPPDSLFAVELSDAAAEVRGTLRSDTVHNRLLCGEGDADLVGFIRAIDRIGFDGPWGVEIISDAHRARPVPEGLQLAYATTEDCFRRARSRGAGASGTERA